MPQRTRQTEWRQVLLCMTSAECLLRPFFFLFAYDCCSNHCSRAVLTACFLGKLHVVTAFMQWRNFFISIYASCSDRHDVGLGNVHILQHLQSDRPYRASTKLLLNLPIQFYLNNVTNRHGLTSQSTISCPATRRSYREHRLLWRHFTLSISRCVRCIHFMNDLLTYQFAWNVIGKRSVALAATLVGCRPT